ncbi:MAG TPA: poly(R)-hydroxyalkanoic acid synthase subunit PhaE [Steroidobacteraceae bacterium]|nr:poly(R)-hydroxyalkanoic acid synthase subunit PhaE [Steroidobacteraceae bacterium]
MFSDRFAEATRRFFEESQSPASLAAATQGLAEFLRDEFANVLRTPSPGTREGVPPAEYPLEAPGLGLTREHQLRAQRAASAWQRLADAQQRLQRLWFDTLREAAAAFVSQIQPSSTPPGPQALHALYDRWIDCAEAAYARTAHGEPFCIALAESVNAASAWRRECAAAAEAAAKLLDLPTRSEVNSLARRLHALEERLRAQAPEVPRRRAPPRARRKR